jgi:hypothetical protein
MVPLRFVSANVTQIWSDRFVFVGGKVSILHNYFIERVCT